MDLMDFSSPFIGTTMPPKDERAAIWEDVVSTIEDNNGELLLPLQTAKTIGDSGISYLKERLR